jgi:hypothetical protein
MAKRKNQKNSYIAVGMDGKMFSITAPNAKTARVVAQNSATPIVSCQRVFKRGGGLGKQVMRKSDIFAHW